MTRSGEYRGPMPDDETPAPSESAQATPAPDPETGYTDSGVPTLEGVRDKIEARYGTALGHTELAAETPEAREAEERYEARKQAAADRLTQIRESMHKPD
jgi:phage shock protein A